MRKFYLILLFLWAGVAQAQTTFTATSDRGRILIGEQFHLQLKLTQGTGQFPPWQLPDTIPHFEVMETSKLDTLKTGTSYALQQTLTLTSWDSGKWQIPPIALPQGIATKPIDVTVAFSSPFDPKQPYHDIKDILPVEKPARTTWYWFVILGLILLLLILLIFPSKKGHVHTVVPDTGYYKRILQQLQALDKDSAKRNEPKRFYTEMVSLFREYLVKRTGIQSHSQTTDDLTLQLDKIRMDKEALHSLIQTLKDSDFVKFAKYVPSSLEMQQAVKNMQQSIINIEDNN